MLDQAQTLPELLDFWALRSPESRAFIFLQNGCERHTLNFGELRSDARAIARELIRLGLRGERALLAFPPGLEFISAFFGCLYAGVVAVPCYPPRAKQAHQQFDAILKDCGARVVLTPRLLRSRIEKHLAAGPDSGRVSVVSPDDIECSGDTVQDIHATGNDVAMLQYTSGSTGTPKGVILRHRHLIANEKMIREAFGHDDQTVVVGWLPTFHDMGLIGNVLQPLSLGRPCILMSPLEFAQKPIHWLRAISTYQATTAGGPCWGFQHCLSRTTIQERVGLDLSRWRLAYVGAEPIHLSVLERFAEAFADHGFERRSFYSCYGLAEASLFVTGGSSAEQADVGKPRGNTDVRIVDPRLLTEAAAGETGEVWVSGESVASGYWGRAEETEQTFGARLAGAPQSPYLRTGDLGRLDEAGRLYITGRLRDIIIVRGQNHFAEDIETTVRETHTDLAEHARAAFSVEGSECERLVIAQEVGRQLGSSPESQRNLELLLQARVSERHGRLVPEVVFVKPGRLPRTSSGKIRRQACREEFLRGGNFS